MSALLCESLFTFYAFLILSTVLWIGSHRSLRKLFKLNESESKEPSEDLALTLILGLSILGAAGYIVFWIYLINASAGRVASYATLAFTLYRLAHLKTFLSQKPSIYRYLMVLFVATGLFYLAALYMLSPSHYLSFPESYRFRDLPGDNELQKLLGSMLRKGSPIHPFYGDWLVSDRPPLLTGLYLMFSWDNQPLFYRAIAVVSQLFWLLGLFAFSTVWGTSKHAFRFIILGLVLNGFVMLNSVYTWPKMLAAGYFLLSLAAFRLWLAKRKGIAFAVLCGSCLGLASLSHAGVVFSMPVFLAVGIDALKNRDWTWTDSWRRLGLGSIALVVSLALFLISWKFFQVEIDPPGDRLLKWHLAGQENFTFDSLSMVIKRLMNR